MHLQSPHRRPLPGYDALYRRWECEAWGAFALDFTEDALQWQQADESQRRACFHIGRFAGFYHLEASVTDTLGSFIASVPRADQRIYLATQIADEARHTVFFDRFYREVLGYDADGIGDVLVQTASWVSPACRSLIDDRLPDLVSRLLQEPGDMSTLVEAVTTYHLLIEAMIGLPSQRVSYREFQRRNLFPGFRRGLTHLMRDETRHVLFGVRFLRDAIHTDPDLAAVISRTLTALLPGACAMLEAPEPLHGYLRSIRLDPSERLRLGLASLRRKLAMIGLDPGIVPLSMGAP